jgi:hypothetical protein
METISTIDATPTPPIESFIKSNFPTEFYTIRLGLPQKKNNRGRPEFEGALAKECNALYDSTQKVYKEVYERFKNKQQFRDEEKKNRHIWMPQYTAPLLDEYGETIWSAAPSFSIVPHTPKYPKNLKHDDENDRARLATLDLTYV